MSIERFRFLRIVTQSSEQYEWGLTRLSAQNEWGLRSNVFGKCEEVVHG